MKIFLLYVVLNLSLCSVENEKLVLKKRQYNQDLVLFDFLTNHGPQKLINPQNDMNSILSPPKEPASPSNVFTMRPESNEVYGAMKDIYNDRSVNVLNGQNTFQPVINAAQFNNFITKPYSVPSQYDQESSKAIDNNQNNASTKMTASDDNNIFGKIIMNGSKTKNDNINAFGVNPDVTLAQMNHQPDFGIQQQLSGDHKIDIFNITKSLPSLFSTKNECVKCPGIADEKDCTENKTSCCECQTAIQ